MSLALALLFLAPQEDLTVLRPEEQPRRMLYRYLEAEGAKLLKARAEAVAALRTPEEVERRREEIRARFLGALGPFPERTPLRAKVLKTAPRDGYRVENVVYESRPDHHVPANLYVPEGKGPFPAILFPVGHYGWPRAAEEYQRTCILLAKNGFVVLTYDPPGQGERHQLVAPGRGPAAHGTTEHTLIDCGALLAGACVAQYFIWDGIRSLDYLVERPEVDPKRLGCMGHSGGGAVTAYLMAVDDRIACAVPSCFITSLDRLYATLGPGDGEQNIPGLVALGMDHADYLLLRAPRPVQLSCPTRDIFDIEGSRTTFREARRLFGILGHEGRVDLFEWDDKHAISKPFREAAVRWMRRWLMNVDEPVTEPDFPIAREEELRVTSSGHVLLDFKGKTLYDATAQLAEKARLSGGSPADTLIPNVRRLIAIEPFDPASVSSEPAVDRPFGRMVRQVFEIEPGIRLPALSFTVPGKAARPKILVVHGEGKAKAVASVERWVKAGFDVTALDLRGMGETEPEAPHKGLQRNFRADWREAYLGFTLKRPLLGQRVRDLLAVRAAIDPDGRGVHVIGVGSAAPVALHAAALDPRITEITLEGMVVSWSSVARTPLSMNQLTNVVPGALRVYDLPDLAKTLAPRPLRLLGSTDGAGNPLPPGALERAYAFVTKAYELKGAGERLTLGP